MPVAAARPVATVSTRVDVLLDPELPETALDVLTGVAQISAAHPLRCTTGAILGAVHPGAVVVLCNPTAAIVEILVAWGGTVMAVRDDSGPRDRGGDVARWLADVVDAGASAALVRPDTDTLALTLATVLQEQSPFASNR
jgi:hypothetical protein